MADIFGRSELEAPTKKLVVSKDGVSLLEWPDSPRLIQRIEIEADIPCASVTCFVTQVSVDLSDIMPLVREKLGVKDGELLAIKKVVVEAAKGGERVYVNDVLVCGNPES